MLDPICEDITKARNEEEVLLLRDATPLKQASKWGMRAIQKAFPRLKDTIICEPDPEEDFKLCHSREEDHAAIGASIVQL